MSETGRKVGGRTAVVLFNLGGPDRPAAVRPYLRNLFGDPAIIDLPLPLRSFLAHLIATLRAPKARAIYDRIGGGSPLVAETEQQAEALAHALGLKIGGETRCFIAMRHWHPRAEQVLKSLRDFDPDRIVLLPLYPQYSSTTSGSSFAEWKRLAGKAGLKASTCAVCCYPTEPGMIAAQARVIRDALEQAATMGRPRLLFSAHGLPKKIVAAGDPYQWQVERTGAALAAALGMADLDWRICYQSRVGPLEWLGPSTLDELKRAGAEARPVVVVPVAFVSEHAETLVELDLDYREQALQSGVPLFIRTPALGSAPEFIDGLARLVEEALAREGGGPGGGCIASGEDATGLCPQGQGFCPLRQGAACRPEIKA